jgi:hypothetical protein
VVAGHVEQHPAHDEARAQDLDAAARGPARRDVAGVEAVVHLPLPEDVRGAGPLATGLVGGDEDVVGEAEALRRAEAAGQ